MPVGHSLRLLWRSVSDPLQATRDTHAAYGPFAVLRVPGLAKLNRRFDLPFVIATGPRFNREVLTNPTVWRMVTIFRGGSRNTALKRLSNGLARMSGRQHAHYRRAFDRPLRKVNVDKMAGEMARVADEATAAWPVERAVDLKAICYPLMRTLPTDLIFGGDRGRALPIARDINLMLQREWTPHVIACPYNLPGTPAARLMRDAESLERCILDWADGVRGRPDEANLLSIVVNGADENGAPASDAAIVGHIPQLFSATFETCQTLMVSALMLLAQHPRVAGDLLDEVRGRFGGRAPAAGDLAGAPLLDAVIKETLRLLPPVPFMVRVATQDTTIAGYPVPQGGRVLLNPFLTNRMPDLYPDPDSFTPERWATINPTPFEYPAFGAGPRTCPGYAFAINALKIALATVIQRYRVSLVPNSAVRYWVRPLLNPAGEVRAVLHPQDGAFRAEPVSGNIHKLVRFAA
jgi:cytochrome P450